MAELSCWGVTRQAARSTGRVFLGDSPSVELYHHCSGGSEARIVEMLTEYLCSKLQTKYFPFLIIASWWGKQYFVFIYFLDLFALERQICREGETERTSILWFSTKMVAMNGTKLIWSREPGISLPLPCGCMGPSTWVISCFSSA